MLNTHPPMHHPNLFFLCKCLYGILIGLLTFWFTIEMPKVYSLSFCLLWLIPIYLPLRGILKGNLYTFSWSGYVLCFYICHSLTLWWIDTTTRWFSSIECLLSVLLFFSFSYFTRMEKRAHNTSVQ